jgi:glycosyltransferase involved in cell wall biosynthesis
MGGAERQADLLARLMAMRLGSCEVITTRFRRDLPLRSTVDGVQIRRLGTWGSGHIRLAANLVVAFLHFLLHGRRYRIVHVHCLSAFALGGIIGAKLRGCRTLAKVCSIGTEGDAPKVKGHLLGKALWRLFLQADLFVAVTPTVARDLLDNGVPADRIVMVPNAVFSEPVEMSNDATRAIARGALGLPDLPTVLFVGRLVPQKRPDVLMRAWAEVVRDRRATLVLAGDGPEAERIAEWRRASSMGDTVRMFGWRSDPDVFYQAADVFAFPARDESFGNVLAEAMAHGLALATTPVGLARHWIRDGENGILVREDSPEDLADALKRLIADPPLRERLGRQARRDALTLFSADSVVEAYLELYQRLAAS